MNFFFISLLVDVYVSFIIGHSSVNESGRHTALDVQHELTIQTDVLDEHTLVMLLHDSKIEHKMAGAQ